MQCSRLGGGVLAALLVMGAGDALAQARTNGITVGPRVTFVRGDLNSEGSQQTAGAALRLNRTRTTLELSIDYRSVLNDDLTERVRDFPMQASLLLFPVRSRVGPYLMVGAGYYAQRVERLNEERQVFERETARKIGYHTGIGAEVWITDRWVVHGDYRYTFLGFGDDEAGDGAASDRDRRSLPVPYARRLELTYGGSMWAWGVSYKF